VEKLATVLLVPTRAVRFEEGSRVIYVLGKSGMPEAMKIEIGGTSDAYSEVLSGDVQEGDVVVLNPPRTFSPPGMMGQ
jgi:HlyD family secretion protein